MFAAGIGPQELIIALVIILVLFGGSQVPKLARNLGRAQREFKDGVDQAAKETSSSQSSDTDVTDTTGTETKTG
jgi:sec-independent protein translocase protein TatA